jgi:putative nucleotidyltransferase with HDIG domain
VLGVKIQQGMPPEGMLPKPLVPAWLSMYNEALVKGPYRFIYEMKTIGKTLELSFNLLRVDGNTIGISVLSRDISEIFTQRDKLREANESLSRALGQTIDAISKIAELRDAYTAGHQKRVKTLACEIARVLGLPDEDIKNISFGALIHDIGKVYIPSEILTKPGKITQLEFKIIQTHAERGYHVVKNMDIDSRIPTMVYQHHERLDGSGYPQGLTGEEIILESRILAVADVVEAMISHRPYRAALGVETALEEITHHRGKKYDPIVVDACLKLFREKNFEFEN